jgi:hypothetical protein
LSDPQNGQGRTCSSALLQFASHPDWILRHPPPKRHRDPVVCAPLHDEPHPGSERPQLHMACSGPCRGPVPRAESRLALTVSPHGHRFTDSLLTLTPPSPPQTTAIVPFADWSLTPCQHRQIDAVQFSAPARPSSSPLPGIPVTSAHHLSGMTRKEPRLPHPFRFRVNRHTVKVLSSARLRHEGQDRAPSHNPRRS